MPPPHPSEETAEAYLHRHHLRFYLRDAVRAVLANRRDPIVSTLAAYFRAVRRDSSHAAFRSFEYVFQKNIENKCFFFFRILFFFRFFFEFLLSFFSFFSFRKYMFFFRKTTFFFVFFFDFF